MAEVMQQGGMGLYVAERGDGGEEVLTLSEERREELCALLMRCRLGRCTSDGDGAGVRPSCTSLFAGHALPECERAEVSAGRRACASGGVRTTNVDNVRYVKNPKSHPCIRSLHA